MSEKPEIPEKQKHIAEIIVLKFLGYSLLLLGVIAIIAITYNIWNLYDQPELVGRFAVSLQGIAQGGEQIPLSLLKIAAWQIVILLMLVAGKVAIWLIEGGDRLLNNR